MSSLASCSIRNQHPIGQAEVKSHRDSSVPLGKPQTIANLFSTISKRNGILKPLNVEITFKNYLKILLFVVSTSAASKMYIS